MWPCKITKHSDHILHCVMLLLYPHSILPRGGRWGVDAQSGRGLEGGNMLSFTADDYTDSVNWTASRSKIRADCSVITRHAA